MLLQLHRLLWDVWCSAHLRRFGERRQVKRGTGKNNAKNEAETRKLIAHTPTVFCTLKLTLPHGLRLQIVPAATATLEELEFSDNSGNR
jgi:hypothetical protein